MTPATRAKQPRSVREWDRSATQRSPITRDLAETGVGLLGSKHTPLAATEEGGRLPMGDSLTRPGTPTNGPRPTSVYRYYDQFGVLIYVGITDRGTKRQSEHNSDKEWWPFVARQDVEHYDSRPEAAKREKALIHEFRPPFNRQHNPDASDLRYAYLAFAEQTRPESLNDVVQRIRRKLPLVPFGDPDGPLILRTEPTEYPIAVRLQHTQGIRAQGIGPGGSAVLKIGMAGPFALVHLSKPAPREVLEAFGTLRYLGKMSAPVVHLTSVQIRCVVADDSPNRIKYVRYKPTSPVPWLPCMADGCDRRQAYARLCVDHLAEDVERDGAA